MRSIFPPQTVRAAPYVAGSDYVAHARRPASVIAGSASHTHPGNESFWEKVVPPDHELHLAGQRVKGTVGRSMGENHRRGGTPNAPRWQRLGSLTFGHQPGGSHDRRVGDPRRKLSSLGHG